MSSSTGAVIDADGHVAEDIDALRRSFPEHLRHLGPRIAGLPGYDGPLSMNGSILDARFVPPSAATPTSATDPWARVAHLDAEGIDAAVLFPTIGLLLPVYREARVAAAFCVAVNEWLIDFCDAAPDRLAPVSLVSVLDAELAVDEAERAAMRGAVAVMVRPNPVEGRSAADAAFDPFWSAAAELDLAVILHEGTFDVGIATLGSERASTYGELHAMAHPFEIMALLLKLHHRGVLAANPGLRIGCFEAGFGWAPYWEHRLETHQSVYGDPETRPLLRANVWVTAEPDEPEMPMVPSLGWETRVCFATDHPHADALGAGAVARAVAVAEGWDDRYLQANALELYGDRLRRRIGG